jgi:flotillin
MQVAQIAEIEARKQTSLQEQQAIQEIGQRKAETDKQVGISTEVSAQEIKEQQRVTKEKEMNVLRVEEIKKAEIEKEKNLVQAEQSKQSGIVIAEGEKQKNIIQAEGNKQKSILQAEGNLQMQKLGAEGIKTEGEAKAEAEKAMQLAPISAQITLAKEIGENQNYQHYLLSIRKIEADQAIGIKQAEALKEADLKIIANSGEVTNGVNKIMDIFSSKGGTEIGGMLEGLAQTEQGKNLLAKILEKKNN